MVRLTASSEGGNAVPFNDLRRDEGSLEMAAAAVAEVVASGYYLSGPNVAAFEQLLGEHLGVAGVVAVANGTDALALALAAFDLPAGSRVLVPANAGGYASVASRLAGYVPLVVDVDPSSLLVTLETLQAAATADARAVVVTHLYGQVVPDVEAIRQWCDATSRILVEDCAQAAGATCGGKPVGSFGHAAGFSFYPTKNLAAMGDAGAVATTEPGQLDRLRQLAQYGWDRRYLAAIPGGRNSRMDELQAAVLRVRLPRLAALNERRGQLGHAYAAAVADGPLTLTGAGVADHVWHLAVLQCDDRSRVEAHLRAHGVTTALHYPYPDHLQPGLSAETGRGGAPVAEDACRRVLTLPCFPTLTDGEVSRVVDALGAYTPAGG